MIRASSWIGRAARFSCLQRQTKNGADIVSSVQCCPAKVRLFLFGFKITEREPAVNDDCRLPLPRKDYFSCRVRGHSLIWASHRRLCPRPETVDFPRFSGNAVWRVFLILAKYVVHGCQCKSGYTAAFFVLRHPPAARKKHAGWQTKRWTSCKRTFFLPLPRLFRRSGGLIRNSKIMKVLIVCRNSLMKVCKAGRNSLMKMLASRFFAAS